MVKKTRIIPLEDVPRVRFYDGEPTSKQEAMMNSLLHALEDFSVVEVVVRHGSYQITVRGGKEDG